MVGSLPDSLPGMQAQQVLKDNFEVDNTYLVMYDSAMDSDDKSRMVAEIDKLDGVESTLGLRSFVGPSIPENMIPADVREILQNGDYEITLINTKYEAATDEINAQIDAVNNIIKKYDKNAMVVGEAPCTKDLITITSWISIIFVFVIIAFVLKSVTLPVILVAVIEFAITINLGIPGYTGTTLPFIASIVISTIQLGSTVDYAILMTSRYLYERNHGLGKTHATRVALASSMKSIIVSALSFFAATFVVISDADSNIVMGVALPGLSDALSLTEDQKNLLGAENMEIPEYVEITADTVDCEVGPTMTMATPGALSDLGSLRHRFRYGQADG